MWLSGLILLLALSTSFAGSCVPVDGACDTAKNDCCKDGAGVQMQCVYTHAGHGQCISGLSRSIRESSFCIAEGERCNPRAPTNGCCKDSSGRQLACLGPFAANST